MLRAVQVFAAPCGIRSYPDRINRMIRGGRTTWELRISGRAPGNGCGWSFESTSNRVDFAKSFDLINHEKLLVKLQANDVPPHILRWMGSFLLNRTQQVKIGKTVSSVGYPKGGVPQGTVSGPRNFIIFINDLTTIAPIYKYVDDSTIFEVDLYAKKVTLHKSKNRSIWLIYGLTRMI